jgi:hypothetical protein
MEVDRLSLIKQSLGEVNGGSFAMRLRFPKVTAMLALTWCASSLAAPTLFSFYGGKQFEKCAFSRATYIKSAKGVVFSDKIAAREGDEAGVGVVETPEMVPGKPFDQVVPSWSSYTPDGAYLTVLVKVRIDGKWTRWYKMEIYDVSDKPEPKKGFRDGDDLARVGMDTLEFRGGKMADAVQARFELRSTDGKTYPTLRFASVNTNDPAGMVEKTEPIKSVWGTELDIPYYSQLSVPKGNIYCSPTSTAMVLGYWARKLNRPELDVGVQKCVDNCIDHDHSGSGHWSFNTAYAGEFKDMIGYVDRYSSLSRIEWWIARGVPVIVSHDYGVLNHWKDSAGHLAVIRGFTKEGDVIFNDPWTPKDKLDQCRKVFKRADFENCWLGKIGSQGTVYIIHPEGWKL